MGTCLQSTGCTHHTQGARGSPVICCLSCPVLSCPGRAALSHDCCAALTALVTVCSLLPRGPRDWRSLSRSPAHLEIPLLLLLCIYKPLPSPQCTGMTTVKAAKESSGRSYLVTCVQKKSLSSSASTDTVT